MLAALALALALAADPEAPRTVARTLSGRIAAVSAPERSATIAGAEETVTLAFDRNTLVFLEASPGTVADLAVGLEVRASIGSGGVAYWIEVKKRASTSPASPARTPSPTQTRTETSTPTQASTPTTPKPAEPAKP